MAKRFFCWRWEHFAPLYQGWRSGLVSERQCKVSGKLRREQRPEPQSSFLYLHFSPSLSFLPSWYRVPLLFPFSSFQCLLPTLLPHGLGLVTITFLRCGARFSLSDHSLTKILSQYKLVLMLPTFRWRSCWYDHKVNCGRRPTVEGWISPESLSQPGPVTLVITMGQRKGQHRNRNKPKGEEKVKLILLVQC